MRRRARTGQPPLGYTLTYPGLAEFYLLNGGAGKPVGTLRRAIGTPTGASAPTWGRAEETGGAAMTFTAGATGTSYLDYGTDPFAQDLALKPFSVIARVFCTGSNTNSYGIAQRNDNNTVNGGWAVGFTSTTGGSNTGPALIMECGTTNCTSIGTPPPVLFNKWLTVAFTHDASLNAANIQHFVDGNGPLVHLADQTGIGTIGVSDAADTFQIGNLGNYTTMRNLSTWSGSIAWVALFRRQLSAAEVMEWTGPAAYRKFVSPLRPMFGGGGGGGGAVTVRRNAALDGLSASGAFFDNPAA